MADTKTPTYSGFDLSTLPKRQTKRTDIDAARALLAEIESNGAASDMASYKTAALARNAGLRAQRLVEHVAPAGKRASIRTFGIGKDGKPVAGNDAPAFGFVVVLKDEKADETAEA